jgi:hypothetical protein
MFEIFGSAMPAVDDFESGLWIVEVAKSEGLGLTVQDLPCAALCKCCATWASATRGAFLGSELILRYQWAGDGLASRLAASL